MMADNLSQKVCELSQRLKELQSASISNPTKAPEILSDALDSLHASLEALLSAEMMLRQNNEECIKFAQKSSDSLALAHALQVQKIELEMQNEELKRAKLETEEVLSKYNDLYDFSPIGLFTLDTKGHIIEANLTGATLLGMARGSIINRRFRNFIAPKDHRLFDEFYKKAFESSVKETCELSLLKYNGSAIYVRVEGIATEDISMNEKRFGIAIIDITERKLAEEALHKSEEHFSLDPYDAPTTHINDQLSMYQEEIATSCDPTSVNKLKQIFPGESEMARRMRALDWSTTDLGSPETWPENLCTALGICLTSRFPLHVWWGPNLTLFYNDAYISFLGTVKHPAVLGRSGREAWSEIWDQIGPMIEKVFATGKASWSEDILMFFDRELGKEEVYVTFSFSPVFGKDGKVEGMFCACTETTEKIIGNRRLDTLRKLGIKASEAQNKAEACKEGAEVLGENFYDIPFAAIYLVDESGENANLAASTGISEGGWLPPQSISFSEEDKTPLPLVSVLRTKRPAESIDLGVELRTGPWSEPVREVLVLPIRAAAHENLTGLLVAGVSPRHPLDASYRTFFDLVACHIGIAIADACAYEEERKCTEALAKLDRAKTTLFSNVSHEFRTPLNLMLGPLEDLLSQSSEGVSPADHEHLSLTHRNGLRLQKLVNTLLDFSRIEAERIQASYEPMDLSSFTADLSSVFGSAIEKAGMKLTVDCPELPEPVYVDRDMWEKIVLNLLPNAFKFAFEGEIYISLLWCGDYVELRVKDTGIAPEEMPYPDGNVLCYLDLLARPEADIIERKQTDIELRRSKDIAEAALHAKSEFLAVMSHELRTPLNGILGMASLLAVENLSYEQREYVDIIRSCSESLLVNINDILNFAKVESGKVTLEKKPFNLRGSITNAVSLISSRAKEKSLDIACFIDGNAPKTIISDQIRLRQVLLNLLDNAIKFTDKGRIDVSVSGRSIENGRQEILFFVKDTGIGISGNDISKLFQPFSQVDMSITRKYGGTGLGLAISKGLVELMGGKIWVESEAGRGSTFHFTIIADEPSDNSELALQMNMPEKGPMRSCRVLLAEDNEINRAVTLRMLKKLGYTTDAVASGREAIESLKRQHYDIILMDLQMSDTNGLEATKEIRKLWPNNGPRIIALTAHALEGDREKCIEAGMDDYIAKPVRIEDLKAALQGISRT